MYLRRDIEELTKREKNVSWISSKLKMPIHPEVPLTKWICTAQTGGKMFVISLTKDCYPEYIKNSVNSIIQK